MSATYWIIASPFQTLPRYTLEGLINVQDEWETRLNVALYEYHLRRYGSARQLFEELVALDSEKFKSAYGFLAHMYANGFGCTRNQPEALRQAGCGMTKGDMHSYDEMGYFFWSDQIVHRDIQYAISLFLESEALGSAVAPLCLGLHYMKTDPVRAIANLEVAKQRGNFEANHRLGQIYEKGECGIKPDLQKAFTLFREGARQAHVDSIYDLGRFYMFGFHVILDQEKAVNMWRSIHTKHPKAHEALLTYLGNKDL